MTPTNDNAMDARLAALIERYADEANWRDNSDPSFWRPSLIPPLELGAVSSVTEQASDGGASDAELLGNGGFAQPFAGEVSDFLRLRGDFGGPAVRTAFFAGLSYARLR